MAPMPTITTSQSTVVPSPSVTIAAASDSVIALSVMPQRIVAPRRGDEYG
jgi:hypothetical protein